MTTVPERLAVRWFGGRIDRRSRHLQQRVDRLSDTERSTFTSSYRWNPGGPRRRCCPDGLTYVGWGGARVRTGQQELRLYRESLRRVGVMHDQQIVPGGHRARQIQGVDSLLGRVSDAIPEWFSTSRRFSPPPLVHADPSGAEIELSRRVFVTQRVIGSATTVPTSPTDRQKITIIMPQVFFISHLSTHTLIWCT